MPCRAESVLVIGVLLRGSAVFVRVGLLGLALQRAIGTNSVSLFLEDACGANLVRRSSPDARAKRCPGGAEADIPPARGGAELGTSIPGVDGRLWGSLAVLT